MKKTVYKVLSVITALCVLLAICPVSAYASTEDLYQSEEVSVIQFSPDTELEVETSATTNRFYSSAVQLDTTKYF